MRRKHSFTHRKAHVQGLPSTKTQQRGSPVRLFFDDFLLEEIISFLDAPTLLNFMLTCKRFHHLGSSPNHWSIPVLISRSIHIYRKILDSTVTSTQRLTLELINSDILRMKSILQVFDKQNLMFISKQFGSMVLRLFEMIEDYQYFESSFHSKNLLNCSLDNQYGQHTHRHMDVCFKLADGWNLLISYAEHFIDANGEHNLRDTVIHAFRDNSGAFEEGFFGAHSNNAGLCDVSRRNIFLSSDTRCFDKAAEFLNQALGYQTDSFSSLNGMFVKYFIEVILLWPFHRNAYGGKLLKRREKYPATYKSSNRRQCSNCRTEQVDSISNSFSNKTWKNFLTVTEERLAHESLNSGNCFLAEQWKSSSQEFIQLITNISGKDPCRTSELMSRLMKTTNCCELQASEIWKHYGYL